METKDIKTVMLCIDVIEKAGEILSATANNVDIDGMTESGKSDIFGIGGFCKDVKKQVDFVDRYIEDMRESLSVGNEQEIEDAVVLIEDILNDNVPLETPKVNALDMLDVAHRAAGIERRRDCKPK